MSENTSFSSVESQRQFRIEKLTQLKELGQNPFAVESKRDYTLYEVKQAFNEIAQKPIEEKQVTLAGRIKSKRVSGKIAFATIEDESLPEGFQFIFRINELPEAGDAQSLSFADFKNLLDEGDYIQAYGTLDASNSGEPSLFVTRFSILTKALRPLPESLEYDNVEERYLNRVVDFKMNTKDEKGLSVRDIVRLKNKYWSIWREEMAKEGFLEVECPVFEAIPGGAETKPFTTFYNELDQEMYLRISLELPLKRLIAGGFEKVFEIGRIFRNEGSSPQHLQEYTQIEWYWAYADYTDGARFVKRVYQRIVQEILGTLEQTDYYGHTINWGEWCTPENAAAQGWQTIGGWPLIPYYEAVRFYSGGKVDMENKTHEELMQIARNNGVEFEPTAGVATLMDKIFKKTARVNMHDPFFLILTPVELESLAKRDPSQPHLTQRWQVVAGTAELGKCFSELNDPIDQYDRFQQQQAARDNGDEEAQFMDESYVQALELGLPPLAGFGTSERFLSFLLGKHIKECVTFPHVRSQEDESGKAKRTMVAHSVILDTPDIPYWSKMNAAAHLAASFASREGKKLIHLDTSDTKDGEIIPMNIQHAIVMKSTQDRLALLDLKHQAEEKGLLVSVFTEEMRDSSDDTKVEYKHSTKTATEIGYLGVLVYGRKGDVEEVTDGFAKMGE